MSHTMKTALGYIRVSTGKQAEHGVSLEAQREKIEAYCMLHDMDLLDILEDASSAKSIEGRPAMKKLLKIARKRGVDAVVTIKLDRMFRNTVEAITIIPELQSLGVATHIMDIGGVALDTSTPMGGFFLTMAAAFSELERKQIAERTRNALRHKRDHGDQYSAIAPYGWQIMGGKVVPEPHESRIVNQIFTLHRHGHSPTSIAFCLDGDGIKPRNARLWSPATIGKILKHSLNIDKHAADSHPLYGVPSSSKSYGGRHVQHG